MKKDLFDLEKFKKIIYNRSFADSIFKVFKKEYKVGVLLLILFFLVFFAGQMISVVGSRQIIEPVRIEATDVQGKEIDSLKRYMQLARSGNYTYIRPNQNLDKRWTVDGVFMKKILLGLNEDDLSVLANLDIWIGDKPFHFSGEQIKKDWHVFDKSLIKSELQVEDYDSFLVLEAPEEVSLGRSKIPIYKSFFGSLINWSGDDKILIKPFVSALILISIFFIFGLILRVMFLYLGNGQIDCPTNRPSSYKRQFIVFSITIVSTVGLLFILNYFVYYFYKPDISEILNGLSGDYLDYFYKNFRPKPVERLQFILSSITSPFVLWFFYALFNKKVSRTEEFVEKYYPRVVGVSIFFIFSVVYLGLAMTGFYYIQDSFYFSGVGKYLFNLILFPLFLLVFFANDNLSKGIKNTLFILVFFIFTLVFFMNVFNLTNYFDAYTFDPVLYPVSQVMAGKSLLVNLASFYGLYAFFLAPIFKVVGLSVLKFSVVMAFLMVISVFFLFGSMYKIIKNKLLLFLGFFSTIFYSLLATRAVPEYYFQYWPIRYVFPCLSIFLVVSYFKNNSRFLYYISFLFFSIGILWNFDVGVVVFLSWLAVLFYNELVKDSIWKVKIVKMLKHFVVGSVALFLVTGYFIFVTYLNSGQLPSVSFLLQYQKIFLSGYLMIKMIPPPHMWSVVILIYLIGILISVRSFVLKNANYIERIILFLSILGVGLFSYYEGQSSDTTLFRTSYPALILLVIFADVLWHRIKEHGRGNYGEAILFICIFYVLLSAPFSLFFNINKYFNFVSSGVSSFGVKESAYFENINFIKENTYEKESIFILSSPNQGVYYAESNTRSIVDTTSIADIPFSGEMNLIIDLLENENDTKIFVESPLEYYNIFDIRIKKIIEEKYTELSNSGSGLHLYKVK
ncbi:MAG: hypothetical protein HOA57_00395 [Candidatus Magasanikbacteria bacterium]|jgi:hypothetical protein|nr:hypothetical protein [Candidatus Magasanikbacteria bacterium]MBT4314807.1 hypothetical protein [Candidatus Magasanikbacteria bacterium]MBT4547584.1 hypothetical protein [Candidatus Magasanikbacteria bacterium]MBT6818833.1 hypothetical protein [Candidatus Magasanikbacteria bacterium]